MVSKGTTLGSSREVNSDGWYVIFEAAGRGAALDVKTAAAPGRKTGTALDIKTAAALDAKTGAVAAEPAYTGPMRKRRPQRRQR
jgi:hypothetical protein